MLADCLDAKMHLRVAAGEKFTRLVGYIDFGVESAAGEIDGVGCSDDFAFEAAGGILDDFERCGEAVFDIWRVNFWHANVGANRVRLREIEESLPGSAITGVNQVSRIDIAL